MVNDGARQAKKRPLPLPLAPVAPVGARVSANQKDAVRTNAPSNGYRNSSAKAHERNLAKLQLHLPREVVFFDPRRRVYHSHVDLSGWRATDASLQQLQLNDDQNDSPVKSSFHTLSFDGSAHISVRGVLLMLEATTVGGGTLRALRLPRCQLLSRGGGELLDGSSLPRSLTELDVSSCEWVDDKFLRTVARHCSVLAQVTLAHCRRVTDYGVAAFGESYAASLTSLDVGFCTKLTDTALLALLVGSSSSPAVPGGTPIPTSSVSARIRQLNIAGLPLVDGLTLLGLRGPCASRLEILNMSGCTVLRVAALQRLARVRALIRLTKLDLSRCLLVDDLVLTALGMACPQLATLLLAFCSNITDVGIRRVVVETAVVRAEQHNESRQEPTIENQEDFGEEDTGRAIGRNGESGCRQLQTLDITGCFQVTSRGISALGARCPQLRSVTLDGVRRLNSSGIRDLLHGCRKLRTIRWGGILVRNSQDEAAVPGACAAFFSVPHLSDSTIAALTSSALKTLHIGTTQCDTDALASTLLSRTSSSFVISLTDLDVTALATDALCEALGNCCANLRNLRLSRSRYFSATSFLAVLRGCPRLRVLELESCEQICDEILIAVSKAPCCPHLETLILANDWQLTDTGVASLLRPATSLFRLDVRHCPEISLPVLQALAAARGHISEATRDGLTPRHPNVVAFLGRERKRRVAARKITRWLRCKLDARHFFRSIIILARLARFEALLCLRRRSATKIQATWRMWLSKALATARRLRNDRHRQHRAILDAIASQQQDRRLFLHRGAVHSVVSLYRASLVARGWLTPTYIKLLHRSAIRIQALVRGHFGRVEANWFRYELTRSASIVQRVWRGKLGKKMWRSLMEERQQLRRDQEEGDRAALIAQKQTAHHALEAFERETQHAVVLQRWYRTLKNRQVFREVRELRDREAHTRAESKVTEVIRNSTGSVVFQARVWRDCVDRKPELVALEEDAFVAMEKEIEQLKEACIEAHAGSTHASREFVELSKRKNEFERSRIRRKKATEAVKQRIQPFAVRAKQLTMESARELNANRQLQMELRRIRTELRWFHANLRGRLPMEPLLLNGDVESLLAGLTGESSSDDEDTNSAS
ncbi:hypothetical protein PC129_g11384 [Phytophthora cactorum]|uniref:Uncharacterized protein n=1 Tax=Phytophthora cactorum TaxID=29920 RepID=A0A8T1I0Z0_9STRA|nr:hypothetical protein PC129_g11384 [Phytophthora cactorum]